MLTSMQTVFVTDARLAEGQILHKKQTVNKGISLKFRAATQITVSADDDYNVNDSFQLNSVPANSK
jgi:hypothetical protein